MSIRKVGVDLNRVCEPESEFGIRSFNGVFSSRVDMLACRADILNDKDRALLKMYLKNNLTFQQIAQIAGTNESTISRRIRKLTSKLVDSEYIICLRNRDKFSGTEITFAKEHYLDGISQKQIAEKHGMTVYSTRKILKKIREVLDSCSVKRKV